VTVTYEAVPEWPDGVRPAERIVATASRGGTLPDAPAATAGHLPVAVWRACEDSLLPGVATSLDPAGALRLLREAGVPAAEASARLRAAGR
jgi:hypothetical protein